MPDDPFKPLGGSGRRRTATVPAEWTIIAPVPEGSPAAPRDHPKLGLPSQIWSYRGAEGALLGHVYRFDSAAEGKSYRPLCLFRSKAGRIDWRWESWPEPRPLYRLDRLASDGVVLVTEGEKSADAAAELSGLSAVTSPAGAKSSARANWQVLSGRDVVIWPDADEAGEKYAQTAAKLLTIAGARSVRVVKVPHDVSDGWDAANAAEDGWTADQVETLIRDAIPATPRASEKASKSEGTDKERRPRQRDSLIAAADSAKLWHSPQRQPYASVLVKGHREHMPVRSGVFEDWLAGRYYEATGNAPSGQMLNEAIRVVAVRAIETGPTYEPVMRVAWHDGASWLDLGDERWRAVRVGADGWAIVDEPPVKFIRPVPMKALPEPEAGYLLEQQLREFVNAEEGDYQLIVAWLVAALWGKATAYPVLALGGEQGSGKTTIARMLRTICDPSAVPALALPKDERDLFTLAMSAHVLSFDNVSKVEGWFSDAICRLATGAGFLTRKLHSDSDPFFFQGSRPCILNGIPVLTDRADLSERALTVRLLTIGEDIRQSEDDWWERWETALPRILGALLDAISAGVRKYDQVRLARMPRMASFARLMAAVEETLGWEPGTFEIAYADNRRVTADAAFEADPVAMAVARLMTEGDGRSIWEGTATLLLVELNMLVPDEVKRSRFWPTKVNALGSAIQRAAPLLRGKGIGVTHRRAGDQRTILLTTKD